MISPNPKMYHSIWILEMEMNRGTESLEADGGMLQPFDTC